LKFLLKEYLIEQKIGKGVFHSQLDENQQQKCFEYQIWTHGFCFMHSSVILNSSILIDGYEKWTNELKSDFQSKKPTLFKKIMRYKKKQKLK